MDSGRPGTFGGGPGYTDYLSYAATIKKYGERYAKLLSTHTQPGLLLDAGAAGFTSDWFQFGRLGNGRHRTECLHGHEVTRRSKLVKTGHAIMPIGIIGSP
jgi:hypothetical protein